MGIQSVIATIAIFLIIALMMFALVATQTNITKNKNDAMRLKSYMTERKIGTDFNIIDVTSGENTVNFSLLNTGNKKLIVQDLTVYANGMLLDNSYISTNLIPKYDIINSLIWDPGETLNLTVNIAINQNINNTFTIAVGNGASKKVTFITGIYTGTLYYVMV